jgi:uncharacterized membrane protein
MTEAVKGTGITDKWTADRTASICARIFLFTGLPALLLLWLLIPPFQGSDESAHFLRVLAIGEGQMLPMVNRQDPSFGGEPTAGGPVDAGAAAFALGFEVPVHREYTMAGARSLAKAHAGGQLVYARHSNTAIYPPVTYVTASIAAMLAKAAGLPVVWWLYLARLATACVSAAILVLAIRRSAEAAPVLLIAATLPITLFQSAVLTTDAIMLPSLLLFGAMLWRIGSGATTTRADDIATAAALIVIALAKIAYLPIVVLPALAARLADGRWSPRSLRYAAAAGLATAAWLVWAAIVHDKVFPMYRGMLVDTPAQLALLREAPGQVLAAIARTMARDLPSMTFGLTGSRLGQNDLLPPKPFIVLALAALVASAIPAARTARPAPFLLPATIGVVAVCYVAIYLLLYLQFTPVGAATVDGVQSRYLTPLAFVLISVAPRVAVGAQGMRWTIGLVGAWSGVSALVLLGCTVSNYWKF